MAKEKAKLCAEFQRHGASESRPTPMGLEEAQELTELRVRWGLTVHAHLQMAWAFRWQLSAA